MSPYCKVEGCDKFVENRDLGLCATHNRERRKVPKEKKTYTISPVSKKRSKRIQKKMQAYKAMDDKTPKYCSGCGRSDRMLSHSHIIPVGQHPEYEDHPDNIVYDCLSDATAKGCHDIWEHGSISEKMDLLNFSKRVKVMQRLAPTYYHRVFTLK